MSAVEKSSGFDWLVTYTDPDDESDASTVGDLGRKLRRTEAASAVNMDAKRLAFQHWFGIGSTQAQLLCLLFGAKGAFLTAIQLAVVESTAVGTVMVRVHRLRQAMDCEAIDSEPGPRYRLTEIGMAECREAMAKFRESLR